MSMFWLPSNFNIGKYSHNIEVEYQKQPKKANLHKSNKLADVGREGMLLLLERGGVLERKTGRVTIVGDSYITAYYVAVTSGFDMFVSYSL